MADTITADDAGQRFAEVLREVAGGKEFVVTRDGVPVARIVPARVAAGKRELSEEQQAALARSLDRARNADWGPIEHVGRDKLYEEIEEERIWVAPQAVTRFTLDSNVLVYAIDRRDPQRSESARNILAAAALCDCPLIPQTLAEFFSAVTRKRLAPRHLAAAQLTDWLGAFPDAAGPTAACVLDAAAAPPDFQFYDALLLATAAEAGCTAIISEDMRPGAALNGVRVVAAFDATGKISADTCSLLGLPPP